MSGLDLAGLFKVGIDILTTSVNSVTGKILVQIGSVTEQTTDGDNVEWWQHVGLASRPSKPDAGSKAAQGLVLSNGDRDICFASQDVRCLDRYGNLDHGETCLYAAGDDGNAQGRVLIKKDGSVTLYTNDKNAPGGTTVAFRISPTGGLEFTCQWGSMILDETGFHVRTQAGPRLDMGGISIPGVPEAVTGAFTGYAKLTAPTVAIEGANCVIGMGPIIGQAMWLNSALAINGGPLPLGQTDMALQAFMGSNTVWISQ